MRLLSVATGQPLEHVGRRPAAVRLRPGTAGRVLRQLRRGFGARRRRRVVPPLIARGRLAGPRELLQQESTTT